MTTPKTTKLCLLIFTLLFYNNCIGGLLDDVVDIVKDPVGTVKDTVQDTIDVARGKKDPIKSAKKVAKKTRKQLKTNLKNFDKDLSISKWDDNVKAEMKRFDDAISLSDWDNKISKEFKRVPDNVEQIAKSSELIKLVFPVEALGLVLLVNPAATEDVIKEILKSNGKAITYMAIVTSIVNDKINGQILKTAEKLGGKYGVALVRFANGGVNFQNSLAISSLIVAGAVLQGEDIGMMRGVLLAAAIRDAIQSVAKFSKPVPRIVAKRLVSCGYNPELVASVRFMVDDGFTISLSGISNFINIEMNNNSNHAVTISNYIVFGKNPGSERDSTHFWAHEFAHVIQYYEKGIEEFANQYTAHHNRLESEADLEAKNCVKRIAEIKQRANEL